MLRVVIDTNVIVSGSLSQKGAPAELLNAWRERRFLLLSSSAIVAFRDIPIITARQFLDRLKQE
jgi:predicted nucleic acid-binding protein